MKNIRFTYLIILLAFFVIGNAQEDSLWHLNPSDDIEAGIEWQKAKDLVADKEPVKIIVAVIDDGVDVEHPDLEDHIWTNPDEIAGNGIDDDNNGYIDDVYGWNFIGKTKDDNMELARKLHELETKYSTMKGSEKKKDPEYESYQSMSKIFKKEKKKMSNQYRFVSKMYTYMDAVHEAYGDAPTLAEAKSIKAKKFAGKLGKLVTKKMVKKDPKNFKNFYSGIKEGNDYLSSAVNYHYNKELNQRVENVGDNYQDVNEKGYGDNDVNYHSSGHGTHVSGIIAANSTNNFGAKGICDDCVIMSIRTVPNGDERDKDVANSIIYAVDNGARVINMSFGKSYSPNSEVVQNAIRYANENGVLLVHAAGNDSENNDESDNFPNDGNGAYDSCWIEVGALSYKDSPNRLASFSNYGAKSVDVFAPGDQIYSTYTDKGYDPASGTSMASPVVAGIAGFILTYYPELTAAEVKTIILQSTDPITVAQTVPGTKETKDAKEYCVSGGTVNLYKAMQLAAEIAAKK